ncbi:D-2-hydroxyacid dehydrogenase [Halorubellus sp. JP-L1]|uniref:D-2-hydroxyacid dehydrogenase n=1 Tax=Halorubellus sp. JP-L1 TaxID=2715753 RepID=UPI00140C626C|nr:D-2-hydroxyacid dehydrogenase [Halorubellus sp. JP-L1]NHN41102.1 D-2-hydroxyacid dehydrogenase [Halorubellus sp. JP-L1]
MSDSNQLTVAVLRETVHGIPLEDYVDSLREHLPDHEVVRARTPSEEREVVRDADVVAGMNISDRVLENFDDVSLFACAFAGTGHLPMDALREKGVAVTNASSVHAPNMGEHALAAVLSFTRRFHVARRQMAEDVWRSYPTHELADSTVTVVGLGAIGTAVAERLDAFDVETVGVRHSPEKGGPVDRVVGYDDPAGVEKALAESSYVVLACPLTDTTEGLLDHDAFVTMPSDAVVVNMARGPVVDTDDLVSALRRHEIRGAALDVTDPEPLPSGHPLWDFDNVLVTPHNAGHTPKYYDRLAEIVAENVKRLADGRVDDEGFQNEVA